MEGERAVGQFLEQLREQGFHVFHDVVGTGFNVDHVLVGSLPECKLNMNAIAHDCVRIDGADLYGSKRHIAVSQFAEMLSPNRPFGYGRGSLECDDDLVSTIPSRVFAFSEKTSYGLSHGWNDVEPQ